MLRTWSSKADDSCSAEGKWAFKDMFPTSFSGQKSLSFRKAAFLGGKLIMGARFFSAEALHPPSVHVPMCVRTCLCRPSVLQAAWLGKQTMEHNGLKTAVNSEVDLG